jgi:hypothetical protein
MVSLANTPENEKTPDVGASEAFILDQKQSNSSHKTAENQAIWAGYWLKKLEGCAIEVIGLIIAPELRPAAARAVKYFILALTDLTERGADDRL